MPTISLKTVYQTVHDLEPAWVRSSCSISGPAASGSTPTSSTTTTTWSARSAAPSATSLLDARPPAVPARFRHGFEVSAVEVNYRGVCDACAATAR